MAVSLHSFKRITMKQIITAIICSLLLIACSKKSRSGKVPRLSLSFMGSQAAITSGPIFRQQLLPLFITSMRYSTKFSSKFKSIQSCCRYCEHKPLPCTGHYAQKRTALRRRLNCLKGPCIVYSLQERLLLQESVLVKDEPLPLPAGDSAMGVRFVNLIQDNIPVSHQSRCTRRRFWKYPTCLSKA